MSIKDVAREVHLDWHAVKGLEKQYMEEQLRRAGVPAPKAIGIDEISLRKGHTYRIVVSDLERRRPIWFGGKDRSEESLNLFYDWLGAKKSAGIRLAVMDKWKAFEKSTRKNVPKATVLYDKFHVMRHLGEALDKVSFHSLRHTAATLAARRGTPVKDLQILFGWRTPSMVFRYAKGDEDAQRRAMSGIA